MVYIAICLDLLFSLYNDILDRLPMVWITKASFQQAHEQGTRR